MDNEPLFTFSVKHLNRHVVINTENERLDELMDVWMGLLTGASFAPSSVRDAIIAYAEDLKKMEGIV